MSAWDVHASASHYDSYWFSVLFLSWLRWVAPEILSQKPATCAADVWSFGVLLYELANNGDVLPYASLSNAAVVAAVQEGRRLDICDSSAPPGISVMLECCMMHDRHRRPPFAVLADALHDIFDAEMAAIGAMVPKEGPATLTAIIDTVIRLPSTSTSVVSMEAALGAASSFESVLMNSPVTTQRAVDSCGLGDPRPAEKRIVVSRSRSARLQSSGVHHHTATVI